MLEFHLELLLKTLCVWMMMLLPHTDGKLSVHVAVFLLSSSTNESELSLPCYFQVPICEMVGCFQGRVCGWEPFSPCNVKCSLWMLLPEGMMKTWQIIVYLKQLLMCFHTEGKSKKKRWLQHAGAKPAFLWPVPCCWVLLLWMQGPCRQHNPCASDSCS